MRKTIFNIDNKNNYKDEYKKIIKVLSSKCIVLDKNKYNYFDFINKYLFNNWNYRDTFIDVYSYLDFIGVNINNKKINEKIFFNLLEFLLNIQLVFESNKYLKENTIFNPTSYSVLFHNIPIILDKYGYEAYDLDDRVLIYKKDFSYEELFDLVPNDIYESILYYNSINNNGIKIKRIILNKIYNYIIKDIDLYKSYNSTVFSSIKIVINKMGIIGDIDKKYKNLSNYKLRKYYDNCFKMMCYLIETKNIYKYRDEIKKSNN